MPNTPKLIRTELERQIRERNMTYEEFIEYVERFARDRHEPGTLSLRHLQRLAAGRYCNGDVVTTVRPATARILEMIFKIPVDVLLRAPRSPETPGSLADAFQECVVDDSTLQKLRARLTLFRGLDSERGALASVNQVSQLAAELTQLRRLSLEDCHREKIASIQSEVCTLAGWQARDQGKLVESWSFYEDAKEAARECRNIEYHVYASTEQAVLLADVGRQSEALRHLERLRPADQYTPRMGAWFSAALGEMNAQCRQRSQSEYHFANAYELSAEVTPASGPLIDISREQVTRWRAHAMTFLNAQEAIEELKLSEESGAYVSVRSKCLLNTDLATCYRSLAKHEVAKKHENYAREIALMSGSRHLISRLSLK